MRDNHETVDYITMTVKERLRPFVDTLIDLFVDDNDQVSSQEMVGMYQCLALESLDNLIFCISQAAKHDGTVISYELIDALLDSLFRQIERSLKQRLNVACKISAITTLEPEGRNDRK